MQAPIYAVADLERNWTYVPSRPSARLRLLRLRSRLRRQPAPDRLVLKPVGEAEHWFVYFIYAPDGTLGLAQRFTLGRLRDCGLRLLVVCAAPTPGDVPQDLSAYADAIVWKALPGFDFSAYSIGLGMLAAASPGCTAIVLNDSLFGPFNDILTPLGSARWDFTGFTATGNVQNHVQSYAFQLRDVTPARMRALAPVLPASHAYDMFLDVVLRQETRFAAVAARTMSVGALLYASDRSADPLLDLALPLAREGFPFLKRSLLGKLEDRAPRPEVIQTLDRLGHPIDPSWISD